MPQAATVTGPGGSMSAHGPAWTLHSSVCRGRVYALWFLDSTHGCLAASERAFLSVAVQSVLSPLSPTKIR